MGADDKICIVSFFAVICCLQNLSKIIAGIFININSDFVENSLIFVKDRSAGCLILLRMLFMSKRPTYEELAQKILNLENRLGQAEIEIKDLKIREIEYAAILANIPLLMMIVDEERRVKISARPYLNLQAEALKRISVSGEERLFNVFIT